jgi:hypothetical protein
MTQTSKNPETLVDEAIVAERAKRAHENEVIVAEIRELKGEIDVRARRIHELSKTLYQKTRRASADSDTRAWIVYTNAWTRFAGMIEQGIRRAGHLDRLVSAKTVEDRTVRPASVSKAAVVRSVLPKKDDFAELYGNYGDADVSF